MGIFFHLLGTVLFRYHNAIRKSKGLQQRNHKTQFQQTYKTHHLLRVQVDSKSFLKGKSITVSVSAGVVPCNDPNCYRTKFVRAIHTHNYQINNP